MSPGAINAWLLMVTTKPPAWRDPLLTWRESPPVLGTPHDGFFYPDPLGFWSEVRRWVALLLQTIDRRWSMSDALSVSALVHAGEGAESVRRVAAQCQPMITLYLDAEAQESVGVERGRDVFSIPDPHRPGTVYEGWWQRTADGAVSGKSPQHPASHRLYRRDDMDVFLSAAPTPRMS
jgi:hypothetical protein